MKEGRTRLAYKAGHGAALQNGAVVVTLDVEATTLDTTLGEVTVLSAITAN